VKVLTPKGLKDFLSLFLHFEINKGNRGGVYSVTWKTPGSFIQIKLVGNKCEGPWSRLFVSAEQGAKPVEYPAKQTPDNR